MYIVFFGKNRERHSAWNTMEEAKIQGNVLAKHGYKHIYSVF
jgi:hypothetical protein